MSQSEERELVPGCHCTALRKATRSLSQYYDNQLAGSGIKITQRAILAQLNRMGPVSVGTLADALVMERGGLAHTLKPLEREGYITLMTSAEDKRSRLISLTDTGRAKLKESDDGWRRAQRHLEESLGPEQTQLLTQLLDTLTRLELNS